MTDMFSPKKRSQIMANITAKNTSPELKVRKVLFALGRRYRLHANDLPGKPDVVFRKNKIAVFINGCFWHQHDGCKRKFMPKSNYNYWSKKLKRNVNKQKSDIEKLKKLGWSPVVIWECETKDSDMLVRKLRKINL